MFGMLSEHEIYLMTGIVIRMQSFVYVDMSRYMYVTNIMGQLFLAGHD